MKYVLKTKNNEHIFSCEQNNIADAMYYFAQLKGISVEQLLEIFIVEEDKHDTRI